MLAIYRKSLHMKTPTPVREHMGSWLPMDLRAEEDGGATIGHAQHSQYDFSDSFIASGISNVSSCNGICTKAGTLGSSWLLTCE